MEQCYIKVKCFLTCGSHFYPRSIYFTFLSFHMVCSSSVSRSERFVCLRYLFQYLIFFFSSFICISFPFLFMIVIFCFLRINYFSFLITREICWVRMLCQCRPVPRHFGSPGWERQPHTSQQSKLLQYKFESYFRLIFFPLSFFVGRLFAWRWSASLRSSFPGSFSRRSNPGILCCYEVNFTLPSTKTRQEIPLNLFR